MLTRFSRLISQTGFRIGALVIILSCVPYEEAAALTLPPASLTLRAADYSETVLPDIFLQWFSFQPKLGIHPDFTAEIEDLAFCPASPIFCDFSLSREQRTHLGITLQTDIQSDTVERFIPLFAAAADRPPTDAKFSIDGERVVIASLEVPGSRLKQAESVELLLRTLRTFQRESIVLDLPTDTLSPTVTAADRERLGLIELIGEGQTNFKGSPKNRIYNIHRALEQFDGILVPPDEEFSFVHYLGDVDGEHGYLPELVIKHNKTEPEFGGGICQVSSTVFRAAINSGMKILERRNHAYPVQYYRPYGMDATIYIPKPDLRFLNNTPGYILVKPVVEGTKLIFRFYGTKDGRTVAIDGPHILESNPDGSMKTIFSQTVTDKTGAVVIKDNFASTYKSPSLFPHPGEEILRVKPADWSKKQWENYKKIHP